MNHSFAFLVVLLISSSCTRRNTIHAFALSSPLSQQHKWQLRQPSQTIQSHRNLLSHRHPRRILSQTQLKMSSSSPSNLPEPAGMRVKELRAELQSYGIGTKSFFEKSELVEAVVKARDDGAKVVGGGGGAESGPTSAASSSGSGSGSSSSSSGSGSTSTSSSSSSSTGDRTTRLAKEIEKCNSMKVSELKSELASYGISTKSFFEKSEFVRACAEARVDGSGGGGGGGGDKSKQEEYDPSYRDVVMKKMSKEQAAEMGFGGGGFGAGKTSTIDIRLG